MFGSMKNNSVSLELDVWPISYENPPTFYPLWFEKADIQWWRIFIAQNPNIPWYVSALYLVTIFGLQAYMKDRNAIKAKKALIAWNGMLAIFSTISFIRLGQELIHKFNKPEGYYGTVCIRDSRNLSTEFWLLMYLASKFVELGDTYFIVLRKQPLHALQWYHHAMVTVVSWKLFPWGEPISLYYTAINSGIHSFMYSYFTARGLGYRVPEYLAMTLTTLQILQMVVNTGNNLYTVIVSEYGYPCSRHPTSILWSFIIYISLWALFVDFFRKRYSGDKKKVN